MIDSATGVGKTYILAGAMELFATAYGVRDFAIVTPGRTILENSLIKQHRPRFNVNLRDDKNYPYIRLTTSEDHPWMEIARQPRRDGDAYFGPYIPASTARRTMRLLGQHFGVRACRGPLDEKDHRACLYYHIDQCLAPCAKLCSDEEYAQAVRDATRISRSGNSRS